MGFVGQRSRFNDFRDDFLKDTRLKNVDDNLEFYTQYVIARFADQNHYILSDILVEVEELQKIIIKKS
jgi:hypothetical protein